MDGGETLHVQSVLLNHIRELLENVDDEHIEQELSNEDWTVLSNIAHIIDVWKTTEHGWKVDIQDLLAVEMIAAVLNQRVNQLKDVDTEDVEDANENRTVIQSVINLLDT